MSEAMEAQMQKMNESIPGMQYFKGSKTLVTIGAILGFVTIVTFIVVLVFLGIFSFNNSDPNSVWIVRDFESAERSRDAVIAAANASGVDITEGYPVEFHKLFSTWFLWGFWASLTYAILFMAFGGITAASPKVGSILVSTITGLFCTNSLVWLICGFVWRFSKAGSIAAGDKLEKGPGVADDVWKQQLQASSEANGFQLKGGAFMGIYLTAMLILFATIVVGFVVGCMVLCCCDPRGKGDGEPYEQLENEEQEQQNDGGRKKKRQN